MSPATTRRRRSASDPEGKGGTLLGCPRISDDLDRLGQGDEHETAALGGGGVLLVGRRVEIVAAGEPVAAHLEVALQDEDLLAGGMVVGGEAGAGLEAHQRGRPGGRRFAADAFYRPAGAWSGLSARAA